MNYRFLTTLTFSSLAALPLALSGCGGGTGDTDTSETGDTGSTGTGETTSTGDVPTTSATTTDTTTASSTTGDTTTGDAVNFPNCSCADFTGDCHQITADDEEGLQIAANSLEDGSALVLGLGVFELNNQVTIRAKNITVCGQGKGVEPSLDEGTVLDFASQETQSNGIDAVGDGFTVRDLVILDAKKDGLRVEDSDGVTIQRVRATWRNAEDSTNGSYGLYPVKVQHVLIEDSEAYNSSDAGIYVGQCQHAIIRNNVAKGNVAGIEIENTQFADVHNNLAEDNTGGLLIFDLPGNPVIGRDIHIHDNIIRNNNTVNFAPGGTVKQIPVGTGTFAMASRRVEINNNTYENNGTIDIAILSGLVIEGDPMAWALSMAELVGDTTGLDLPTEGDLVFNYKTVDILIHDNSHSGSGENPFLSTLDQELGALLAITYKANLPIDQIVYDTIGESSFSATDVMLNSNDHNVCVGGTNKGATFASLNVPAVVDGAGYEDLYRPPAPFKPFDCDAFTGAPIIAPEMKN